MANRPNNGGFRWTRNKFDPTQCTPPRVVLPIASGYATSIPNGAPVKMATDGTIQLAASNDNVYGVFAGMKQVYNATEGTVAPAGAYTATVTWGTVLSRQSQAYVIPVRNQVFRATCDDNTTATTQAGYEAFVSENVDFAAGTAVGDQAGHVIDISGHATTAEDLRILNVPDKELTNFAGTGVELEVEFQLIQDSTASTTGT